MATQELWGPYWFSDGVRPGYYTQYVWGPDARFDDAAFSVTGNPLAQQVGVEVAMAATEVTLSNTLATFDTTHRRLYATFKNVGADSIGWFKVFITRVSR